MIELIILRHAQAAGFDHGGRDFDRALTEQGRSDALRQGDWMREFHLIPAGVLCSPAVRALQTAEIVCEHLGFDMRAITQVPAIYEATTGDLVRVIEEYNDERILLVGHNPGLAELAGFITGTGVRLSPGSAAWLTFDEPVTGPVQPGTGHLHRLNHVVP